MHEPQHQQFDFISALIFSACHAYGRFLTPTQLQSIDFGPHYVCPLLQPAWSDWLSAQRDFTKHYLVGVPCLLGPVVLCRKGKVFLLSTSGFFRSRNSSNMTILTLGLITFPCRSLEAYRPNLRRGGWSIPQRGRCNFSGYLVVQPSMTTKPVRNNIEPPESWRRRVIFLASCCCLQCWGIMYSVSLVPMGWR